jgi:hypothetical protein
VAPGIGVRSLKPTQTDPRTQRPQPATRLRCPFPTAIVSTRTTRTLTSQLLRPNPSAKAATLYPSPYPERSTMPGTHLLPPNLLKLFSPRPPLVYTRPVDKDIDRVTKKDVSGVGPLLAMLKEGAVTGLANGTPDGMEEGEEPTFTLAEEIKRQIRREERKKKRAEIFQKSKDSCAHYLLVQVRCPH